jgi:hypothetical protein
MLVAACLFGAGVSPAFAQYAQDDVHSDQAQWIVAPYLWALSVSTDLHTGRPPNGGVSSDRNFNSILDDLDGAFLVHAEVQKGHFGAFTDFAYLGLADHHDFRFFTTESDLDSRLFELAGVWNPSGNTFHGFEVFAGLRYIEVDFNARFIPRDPFFAQSSIDSDDSYSDFMLGVRYTWDFGDRWNLTVRGDGSAGETDGTWNVSTMLGYKTHHGAWYFGYRHLNVDVGLPEGHNLDMTLSGAIVGYGFRF